MLSKLINRIPKDWLVYLYKKVPFNRFKNAVVYRVQQKFLVSVLGVMTNTEGQVLLLKHVYRKQPWGIPGGWMELEVPEEGFKRELFEETGFQVKWLQLADALYGTKPNRVDLIFVGELAEGTFIANTEISEICFCSVGEWPEGVPDNQKKLIERYWEAHFDTRN